MMKINLIEYFEESVQRCPQKTAVIARDRTITFSELRGKALVLASAIGCIKRPAAVFLNKSIESVYADLAIIYSGNFYMNLDVRYPAERLKNILDLVCPGVIITNNQYLKSIVSVIPSDVQVINLDGMDFTQQVDESAIFTNLGKLIDTDPLCIINTSGSTGTPKGVVLNHKSFFDFTEWALDTFKFDDNELMGSLSPLVFDIYSFELCMLMAKSSTLVVIPEHLSAFTASILKILEEHKVTFLFWVPTIMVNIANMDLLSSIQLPALKTVWFAGEVFPTKQFNYWRKMLPQTTFANLYGPIEITLDCTCFIVNREIKDEESIPIGFPCRNTDILILDADNKLVAEAGKEGELCVRGTSLAMGYYNNPEKTASAFVQNPLNHAYPETIYRTGDVVVINEHGEIVFKGRKDTLIKHMGYRTELGEIEHIIINKLKLVKNGCVVYNFSKKEITLFYESPEEITPAEFRKRIGQELPKYMLPTVYHHLDELRRNTNGKIDRLFYNNQVNG